MPNTEQQRVLYLPSTPLNLLVAVAHAVVYKREQTSQLVLVDQSSTEDNLYFTALMGWQESPFEQVAVTSGKANGFNKIRERKINFLKLTSIADSFEPNVIAVGSDRRIEFQFLMNYIRQNTSSISGWYMDDGLYSYAGRPYTWFKDRVNSALKKLIYGRWWQEPQTIGASDWINQVWLFSPKDAVSALKHKQMAQIKSIWFNSPQVINFSERVLNQFGLDKYAKEKLQRIDLFLLIPHPNNIVKMIGYEDRIAHFLKQLDELGVNVAVKYHPRSQGKDALNLASRYRVLVLPNHLAFEFVLPLVNSRAIIVGDVSTVLMTAKWLRPDVSTLAMLSEHDKFAQRFKTIIDGFEIPVLQSFDDVLISVKACN